MSVHIFLPNITLAIVSLNCVSTTVFQSIWLCKEIYEVEKVERCRKGAKFLQSKIDFALYEKFINMKENQLWEV